MLRFLGFGAAAMALLIVAGQSNAQQGPQGPGPGASQAEPEQERDGDWWDWRERMRDWMGEDWDPRRMMGWGSGPESMWGGGMPMHRGMMPVMMIALMDTDANGSLSYEEIEAVHQRMFKLVDENKDGELSPDEIKEMIGWRGRDR